MGVYGFRENSFEIKDSISCKNGANAYKIYSVEHFTPQTNGEVSNSITQNWTPQAIECYILKGDCKNCAISKNGYSFVCQMHKIVGQLIELKGEPALSDFLFD